MTDAFAKKLLERGRLERAVVEAACLAIAWAMPARAALARRLLEGGARAVYCLGVPAWLVLRVLA